MALVQRISNCGKIQNTVITPDKVLNVLIYGTLRFDETQYVGEHVKWPVWMVNNGRIVIYSVVHQTSAKNI